MERIVDRVAWAGVVVFVAVCLAPVAGDWSDSVVGPYGGADPMLQTGLLQWTSLQWHEPAAWLDLPIFHPVPGMLGAMDSLLGQAWLVWPVHLLFEPTAAALYNLAIVLSLLLAALGMAALWRATAGSWRGAGVAALAMVAAPYTISQLGHLNQLPPPPALFGLAATVMALRRQEHHQRSWPWWWAVGASLTLQAAWGWYGLAYLVVGVIALKVVWLIRAVRAGERLLPSILSTVRSAGLAAVLTAVALGVLAQPQLRLADRYPHFERGTHEVRSGSADIQHVLNRGAYHSTPADWVGRGPEGPDRYRAVSRVVLNPGWVTLVLAIVGFFLRRTHDAALRRQGTAMLVVGLVGFVFAFGDSVGVPGTDRRLPLPLEWVRTVFPPFRAFRAAWRFSWLMVIAMAWWAAYGTLALAALQGRRRWLALGSIVVLLLTALPVGLPAAPVLYDGWPLTEAIEAEPGPVLALPGTFNEFLEDQTEARWLLRAIELGRPVTGGATGWVPPEIREFRERLHWCEKGQEDVAAFLAEMRGRGFTMAEIALREGDEARIEFWRAALVANGAVRVANTHEGLLESYRLF